MFLSLKLRAFRTGFCLTKQFNTDVYYTCLGGLFFHSYISYSHLRIRVQIISSAAFANSLQLQNFVFVVFCFPLRVSGFTLRDYSSALVPCKIYIYIFTYIYRSVFTYIYIHVIYLKIYL